MSEFDTLVETICNAATPAQQRAASEKRLMDMLSDASTWKQYSSLLFQANDTVCFFICIGFQKMVWRHWRKMAMEDRMSLNQAIVGVLTARPTLQPFARSKLEQVLAAICANSCSIEPALGLLVEASNPAVSTGLSAMRTVLELVLSDDPQLYPEYKSTLLSAVSDIVSPLTNLACGACSSAVQAAEGSAEQKAQTLVAALELLKVIIGKLQIGPHVTTDVIDLLFSVAQLGAAAPSSTTSCSGAPIDAAVLERAALSAIEVLTEVMSKKYLPPSRGADTGSTLILVSILEKSAALLKSLRCAGRMEASPTAMSLLEFVGVFAESHLEKCIRLSTMQSADAAGGSAGSGVVDSAMDRAVQLFLEELVASTSSTMEPEVLHKVVTVWNRVLSLGSVKEALITRPQLCVSMVAHLLQSALLQTNASLRDAAEELVEDLRVDLMADPHVRSVLSHICVDGGEVRGAEEVGFVGTELLGSTVDLFSELVAAPEVAEWLGQNVPQLIGQNIAAVLSGAQRPQQESPSAAALDLHFLVQLLPLISSNIPQLVTQLVALVVQQVCAQLPGRGQEFVALAVTCCHLAGQLLQSGRAVPASAAALTAESLVGMQQLFCDPASGLLVGVREVCSGAAGTAGPMVTALSVLLLQAVSAHADLLELEQPQCAEVRQAALDLLQSVLASRFAELPVEIVALNVCAQDLLQPHGIAPAIVAQCVELESNLENLQGQNFAGIQPATIEQLMRVTAALDALARNHSISRPARRQCLVAHFAPLQQAFMGKLASVVYRLLLTVATAELEGGGGRAAGALSSSNLCNLARLVVALSCAALQCLGKKSFGRSATDVLNVSVDFAENVGAHPQLGALLFERAGLALSRQLLELAQVLAEATAATSATANEQAATTHRLLCCVAARLNDDRICAELLQPTLKAGVTAVRCYWQKTQKSLPFLASIAQQNGAAQAGHALAGSDSTVPDINGENVRLIAVLLTQLCVGSLSPNVPPQDTLAALEGLIQLGEQHKLFSMNWFQHQCWGSLLTPCLKAVLLRIHNMHRPTLEQLLVALATAGEASYLAMAGAAAKSATEGTNSHLSSPVVAGRKALDSPIMHGRARNVGDIMYAKYQEFWISIGTEMIGIAAQYNCGESASHTLYSVLNSYQAAAVAAGQYNAGISSISPHSSNRGPFLVDMHIFLDKIIQPVASEIARLN